MRISKAYVKKMAFDGTFDSVDAEDDSIKYIHEPRTRPITKAVEKLIKICETIADSELDDALAELKRTLEEK